MSEAAAVEEKNEESELTLKVEPEPEAKEQEALQDGEHFIRLPDPVNKIPEWMRGKIPEGIVAPRGIEKQFVRIRSSWTYAPHKGDRILIVWPLSEGDEKLAYMRCANEQNRAIWELSKQMIRAIDGQVADWSGVPGPANVDTLWREIGMKGRGLLMRLYTQFHSRDAQESADFFGNCIARYVGS